MGEDRFYAPAGHIVICVCMDCDGDELQCRLRELTKRRKEATDAQADES